MTETRPRTVATGSTGDERGRSRSWRRPITWLSHYPMVGVLVGLLTITTVVNPEFWNPINLQNIVVQNAALIVISVGVTFVLIGGGFDLSTGAIYAAGAIVYLSLDDKLPAPLGLLVALVLGVAIGTLNGAIVNILRINPFIATLATASVIAGAMTLFVNDNIRYSTTEPYSVLGNTKIFGWLPLSFLIGLALFVLAGVVLARSTFGRSVYAVGGNREAARLNGVRVGLISGATFAILGGLSALGGVLTASLLGTARPEMAGAITLDSIAIVIIGGTSFLGGEGAIWRTAVGLAIIAIMQNLFAAENYQPALQQLFKGLILLIAVGAEVWFRRGSLARRL